jgi:ABC-type transporter Mla subunit MlaD
VDETTTKGALRPGPSIQIKNSPRPLNVDEVSQAILNSDEDAEPESIVINHGKHTKFNKNQ